MGLVVLSGAVLVTPRSAHAEPPNAKATPLFVLTIETDDSDDQADALTQALRARVRQAQGWSLSETAQSFGTLAIALRCPSKPDSACLQRIGDQLHADHLVWGTMAKHGKGQVAADVHLWSRGKPDRAASETYSDNLKDPGDESMRAVAARIFGRLVGMGTSATIVVHAGTGGGVVIVDGSERGAIDGGVARVNVAAGPHSIQVRVPGYETQSQSATVAAGAEQDVSFALSPESAAPGGGTETKPAFPTRKAAGYSALVAGAGFLVAASIEGLRWLSDYNDNKDQLKHVPGPSTPNPVTDVCVSQADPYQIAACKDGRDASSAATLGWIFAGAGAVLAGAGAWLVMGAPASQEPPRTGKAQVQVLPSIGARGASMGVRITY